MQDIGQESAEAKTLLAAIEGLLKAALPLVQGDPELATEALAGALGAAIAATGEDLETIMRLVKIHYTVTKSGVRDLDLEDLGVWQKAPTGSN